MFFAAEDRMCWCYGSVYAILGDHPSQKEMAGLLGTWAGCWYCHKLAPLFQVTKWPVTIDGHDVGKPAPRGHYGTVAVEHARALEQS